MIGKVSFVGAGPGAADLITVRGAKRIAEADIVVWAASLVDPECVRENARPDAELIDSSLITHEDVLDVYRRAARDQLRVARVHSGDPALWGAVQEQYDSAKKLGLEVEIVPGVSAFSAAAAIAGRELTVPEVAQSVILTRLEGGKTPMPDGEHIREFARHGTTMAIFLSAARSGQLVEELRAGGYPDDTPVIIAYKATWPDELILPTTVGELADTVKQHKLWRHTLFLVGKSLRANGTRSHLYHAGHFHTYRRADPAARRALRSAGGTENGTPPADPAEPSEKRTEFPLSTGRSGWVAAKVVANWTGGTSGAALDPAAGSPSMAAWSAVRDWQEVTRAARNANRPAAKPVRLADVGQLALDGEPEPAPAEAAVPESAPEPTEPVEPTQPVAEPDPEPEPKPKPARKASAKTPAKASAKRATTPRKTPTRRTARSTTKPTRSTRKPDDPGAEP